MTDRARSEQQHLIVVDVGNTHTVAGLYDMSSPPGAAPDAHWRFQTQRTATRDELLIALGDLLELDGYDLHDVAAVAVSSVVPALTHTWRGLGARLGEHVRTLVVEPSTPSGLRIAVATPSELGADRLVNAVAAWERYGEPCIVVDLGTATTFDVVGPGGTYLGGCILPGIAVSVGALVERAARLASVELYVPDQVIGRDTESSLRAGTMLGAVAQVEGLLARTRTELVAAHGVNPDAHIPAIATGGFSTMLRAHVAALDDVDPDLTLRGLQLLALHR